MRRCTVLIGALAAACFAARGEVVRMSPVSCAPSAEAAVAQYLGRAGAASIAAATAADSSGIRVTGDRVDSLTGARWLVLRRCDAPGALPVLRLAAQGVQRRAASPQLIHAGDAVVVESRTDSARVSLPAFALDNGAAGDEVRIRFSGWSDGATPGVATAVVVGRGVVEWRR